MIRKWPVVVALVLVVAASAVTAWGGTRVVSSRDHLQQAAVLIRQLHRELQQVDPAATGTLIRLQGETRAARADADDPIWRAGTRLPVAGDDLTAVRTVATAVDDLARHGLPPFVSSAGLLSAGSFPLSGGPTYLEALKRAAPGLARADAAIRRVRGSVDAIAVEGLTTPVRTAVVGLRAELRTAERTADLAAKAAALLPTMLGVGGARTYLVLLQNLAEVRATGGMPGAFIVVRADRGRITIADQGTAGGIGEFATPVLALAPTDRALYTDKPAVFPADINLSPHFPTAGALAREMYRRRTGVTVDGVFATDPVALSYLLGALGPVPVPGGEPLTAATAVPVLLSRIYAVGVSERRQDEYFAAAARATFRALGSRPLRPSALIGSLARAAGERRLLIWSAHPDENAVLADTVLAGVLPASDGADPTVGVFLNDGSGAKLGYYLTHSAAVAVTPVCRDDGRREITLRVTLGSTAPRSGLSSSVLGLGLSGHPYTLRTDVSLYSPTGGSVVAVKLDRADLAFGSGRDRRRAVGVVPVDLSPGRERTLDVTMLTGVPVGGYRRTVTPRFRATPGVAPWPVSVVSGAGCPVAR